MKRVFFLLVLCSLFQDSTAQKDKNRIEITPYFQLDHYPKFSYVLAGRSSTDYLKLKSSGWAVQASYKLIITSGVYFKAGIGYFRYRFGHIDRVNTSFGNSNERHINFPSPLYISFYTNRYWYNTITLHAGIEKSFELTNGISITGGFTLVNYFTYSQHYHITYSNPDNSINPDYALDEKRNLGFSINLQAAALKKIGRFSLGPVVLLPAFTLQHKDDTFPEEKTSDSRTKWFNALGAGLQTNYSLHK
ncbi:MAG: hypothetical protein INR73_19905 [Williamsia sp.]|nr:hypothetical protein [Williamsia sp.]